EIIETAGQKGTITIATNMPGRGTDIEQGEAAIDRRGLAVIGTERDEAGLIDNQLCRSSDRPVDRVMSRVYVPFEDELMRRFVSENLGAMMNHLGMDDSQTIESKMVSRAVESAQKRVEGNNFYARKTVLSYDDVLREQRVIIYKQRFDVINAEDDLREIVENMIKSSLERVVHTHTQDDDDDNWDLQSIVEYVHGNLLEQEDLSVDDIKGKDPEEMIELIMEKVNYRYDEKEEDLSKEQMNEFEKVILLRTVDTTWMDHIDQMEQLRQGIHLRAYGQNDPLREYQMEGFSMFEEMIANIE